MGGCPQESGVGGLSVGSRGQRRGKINDKCLHHGLAIKTSRRKGMAGVANKASGSGARVNKDITPRIQGS